MFRCDGLDRGGMPCHSTVRPHFPSPDVVQARRPPRSPVSPSLSLNIEQTWNTVRSGSACILCKALHISYYTLQCVLQTHGFYRLPDNRHTVLRLRHGRLLLPQVAVRAFPSSTCFPSLDRCSRLVRSNLPDTEHQTPNRTLTPPSVSADPGKLAHHHYKITPFIQYRPAARRPPCTPTCSGFPLRGRS